MKIDGKNIRPIWVDKDFNNIVRVIDQRMLPHEFVIADLKCVDDVITAVKEMYVRGAPLIGVTAAYGVYLAAIDSIDKDDAYFLHECDRLKAARPTAVNLIWAVNKILSELKNIKDAQERIKTAKNKADKIAEWEAENCKKIGGHGMSLVQEISRKKNRRTVNILTHCNAGWLACIEYGTATAPMYIAHEHEIDIHVWVDETRPLNQGARLTAWELGKAGIKHTVITDNAGGHLMQHGMVDMVIVGTDRTTYTGDVANKIGTYLKALAAKDNNIPFYVALPSSTFDWSMRDGVKEIPIEERDPDEVRYVRGKVIHSSLPASHFSLPTSLNVMVPPEESPAANYAFDVTPARLVTGFITERGICKATENDIKRLFPNH